MRKLKLLLYLIFFTVSCLQAQWQEQLDINYFAYFKSIHFIDENYGWAQATGPYFYTTNGGNNWYLDPNWMNNVGHDIVFVDQNTGFMASNDGIIKKTIDGGNTWIDVVTPTTNDIYRLFFIDENIGWALGSDEGKALRTVNAGASWELQQIFHEEIGNLLSIYFINESIGWGAGYGLLNGDYFTEISRTDDEGNNWNTQFLESYLFPFYDIFFINELSGWVVGETDPGYPFIMHTIDGGENWSWDVELPELIEYGSGNTVSIGTIYSIQFINETDGWFTCASLNGNGYILITTDSGITWQQQYSCGGTIHDICIIDENHAWATGSDFIHFNPDIYYIPIGVDEYSTQNISISPNPFETTIKINNSDDIQIDRVAITDCLGRICFQSEEYFLDQIDLNYLKNGIYFLTIRANQNYLITKKIIKL